MMRPMDGLAGGGDQNVQPSCDNLDEGEPETDPDIHKKKQRGCPLLGANRYTHIYISYICVYIYIIYLFETIISKAWPPSSDFL